MEELLSRYSKLAECWDSIKKEEKNQDVISYTSGNETIIMPASYKEPSGANVVVNIIIGLVVGVALMWFLVVPAL